MTKQGLSDNDKRILLDIARTTIAKLLRREATTPAAQGEPILNCTRGCFVTIHQHGQLRGCIGNFEPRQPLFKSIAEMAVAAASKDPRFPPLQGADLSSISLEISVLTPLEKIAEVEEIEVGRDGIYLERGYHRGVLLPQVATAYGWDRTTFLEQTCHKAGLPADAWKSPETTIYRFSAEIFNEEEFPPS